MDAEVDIAMDRTIAIVRATVNKIEATLKEIDLHVTVKMAKKVANVVDEEEVAVVAEEITKEITLKRANKVEMAAMVEDVALMVKIVKTTEESILAAKARDREGVDLVVLVLLMEFSTEIEGAMDKVMVVVEMVMATVMVIAGAVDVEAEAVETVKATKMTEGKEVLLNNRIESLTLKMA